MRHSFTPELWRNVCCSVETVVVVYVPVITKVIDRRFNGFAAVSGKQIAPLRITIAIVNRALSSTKGSCGVGVFPLAEDVACIVVCPYPRLARSLVVFPD